MKIRMITCSLNFSEAELLEMRALLSHPGVELARADFDELIALATTRAGLCAWRDPAGILAAYAFVDDFNNLCFAWDEQKRSAELDEAIVAWGVECMRRRHAQDGNEKKEGVSLDAWCEAADLPRLEFLKRQGFLEGEVHTLRYERSLKKPVARPVLPEGFSLCSVSGESQAGRLAALHRAAFGTSHMTEAYRLAMMRAPGYDPRLDLFIEAPDGEAVAFCVCGIDESEQSRTAGRTGYTDPVGVDPRYQGQGLGKAVLLSGLLALKRCGLEYARLGTSNENEAMRRLAESVGFRVISENLWFSKPLVF